MSDVPVNALRAESMRCQMPCFRHSCRLMSLSFPASGVRSRSLQVPPRKRAQTHGVVGGNSQHEQLIDSIEHAHHHHAQRADLSAPIDALYNASGLFLALKAVERMQQHRPQLLDRRDARAPAIDVCLRTSPETSNPCSPAPRRSIAGMAAADGSTAQLPPVELC
jgi:hypothetical protein